MKIYIDVDKMREELHELINGKKITDAQSEGGIMFNAGIGLSNLVVDTYLLRIKGQGYQEGRADD